MDLIDAVPKSVRDQEGCLIKAGSCSWTQQNQSDMSCATASLDIVGVIKQESYDRVCIVELTRAKRDSIAASTK